MIGAAAQLQEALPQVQIDAERGRAVITEIALLQQRQAAGQINPVVVMHIGYNGILTDRQFDQIMTTLAGARRVVWVTLKVPRDWETHNNIVLAAGVKRYPNAVLVDWRAASIKHPEYFWGDGIHLRPDGAKVYAAMIAAAVSAP
jgi:hypothetical protein